MACSDKRVSVVRDVSSSVFSRDAFELFGVFARDDHCFFLDGGCDPARLGRYSVFGSRPELVLRAKDGAVEVERGGGVERTRGDALSVLDALLQENRVSYGGPLPFASGAVGYLSYDFGRLTEGVSMRARDVVCMPDIEFGFYRKAVVVDNLGGRVYAAASGGSRSECCEAVGELSERLQKRPEKKGGVFSTGKISSNFTRGEYSRAVERVRDYIREGDVYQVNLSQMFSADFRGDAFSLYGRLRRVNPAPFSAYLGFGGTRVLSSSPERFLRVRGGVVETRPIKGTRPRGKTKAADEKLVRELLESTKDKAEHVMIVDLERNDLGKVCEYGSVRVSEFEAIESYAEVHHMVSTVEGKIRRGVGLVDCVRACFPGGSITGAPKVRSMEIIDELEGVRRGLYTGSVGYLSSHNTMDLNIAIRTMVVRGGRIYFSAGGGVVYDSRGDAEYEETLDKARALFRSLRVEV